MPRTVTTKTETDASGNLIKRRFLVELGFIGTQRHATLADTEWDGHTWSALGIQVGSLTTGKDGSQSVDVSLPNADRSASAVVLGQGVQDVPVTIWRAWGDPPFAADDPVLYFQGVMDQAIRIDDQYVTIRCVTADSDLARMPAIVAGKPLMKFIPPDGTVITMGNETYEFRREK